MKDEEVKVLTEGMVKMGKMATANSLTYMKCGFEAMKKIELPVLSADGKECNRMASPYKENKAIQFIVDFMITYLDEAIKSIENKNEKSE